jgi:hypothetical protein
MDLFLLNSKKRCEGKKKGGHIVDQWQESEEA